MDMNIRAAHAALTENSTVAPVYQNTLARALGISQATVSRALRGDLRISPATRARVEEEARRLGYRPDPFCSALARHSHRNDVLGERPSLVVATVTKVPLREGRPASFGEFDHLAALARERGFGLECVCLGKGRAAQEKVLERLRRRAVRGIFLYETETPPSRVEADLDDFDLVNLYPEEADPRFPRLEFNHFGAMERILEELAARGYRRPGLWLDSLHDKVRGWYPWRAAFSFLGPAGFEAAPMGGGTPEAMTRWIERERIDCLVTFGSREQRFAWAEAGIGPFPGVGLCGLDVADSAGGGKVSGIVQRRALIIEHAFWLMETLLHQRLAGRRQPPANILLNGEWCEGETLRPRPR